MSTTSADSLRSRLQLQPGRPASVRCERPMVGAALLGRLTAGRRAESVPDLLAAVFTLGAQAQRSTSRRAVEAALGRVPSPDSPALIAEAQAQALQTAAEQLQRLALDLPAATSGAPRTLAWLADWPWPRLSRVGRSLGLAALAQARADLAEALHRRLFGLPVEQWLQNWREAGGSWLSDWCSRQDHPVTQWLVHVRADARAIAWPCRPLDVLEQGAEGLRELAQGLNQVPDFAEAPVWRGGPAETAPWTRLGQAEPVLTVWDRLGARLADLARDALGPAPALGALALAPDEGLAWTEMSRGLLLHHVRLAPEHGDDGGARVVRYHVLAPTEWNFHPQGWMARWLSSAKLPDAQVKLAAAALDPCVPFTLATESTHA